MLPKIKIQITPLKILEKTRISRLQIMTTCVKIVIPVTKNPATSPLLPENVSSNARREK